MRHLPGSLAIGAFASGLLLVAGAPAQTVDGEAIDAWLQPWADAGFLSGCLLVARGDVVVYERCFGESNVELGVPNVPTTRFAIASVTKALQNILFARLVEAGAVKPEDRLSRWIEDFPRGDEITLLQVASHEAAIPHRVTEPSNEIFARTAADIVELVKEQGLIGDPGGESIYSSAGYSVMARVLELAADAPWAELMQREVFGVAGMQHTVHPEDRRLIPERASSYVWTPQGYRLTEPKDLSFLVGAGSLYSTPRDLLRLIRTLVDGEFGKTAQEYVLSEGSLVSNGLTNGYRAFADYQAETDLSVILCANVITGALGRLREELPTVFAGEAIREAGIPEIAAMTSVGADLTVYEGSYQMRPGRELGIRSAGDYLDVDGWMLLPREPDAFFCVQDFGRVVFERSDEGKVTGLLWGESEFRMPRVDERTSFGDQIESMVAPYVELRDFSGAILVAEKGEVLYSQGFGMADFELEVPNTPSTRFMIGSVSKQFTAAAILLLEAEGQLRVEDPVSKFLPDHARGDEITLHHLLTHTSGISDIFALEAYPRIRHEDPRLADVVALFRDRPLDFEPGTQYSYTNSGFVLLARIIEVVSGSDYAAFLHDRIFQPLGMSGSGALVGRDIVPGLAAGYDPLGQTDLRRAIQVAPALYTGPGSVYSTPRDLLRWDRALHENALLPDSSRAKMMTDHGHGYGYGVSVFERFGGRVIEHDGRMPGYACDLARYPDREAMVVILGNIQSAMRDRFRDDIASLLHGEDPPERIVRSPQEVPVNPSRLEAVEGIYDFGPNFFVAVRSEPERLFLRANQGEESEFFPVARDEFFSRALYAGARFEFDEDGTSSAMQYLREGRSFRGERRE